MVFNRLAESRTVLGEANVVCALQAAESVSSAASAVSDTVTKAVQGTGIKGIEAPVPKSVQRSNAAKVQTHPRMDAPLLMSCFC